MPNYIIKIKLPLYAKCRFVIAKLWICAFGVPYFIGGMFNVKKKYQQDFKLAINQHHEKRISIVTAFRF